MEEQIKKLLQEIIVAAYEISLEKNNETEVFVRYNANVQSIDVDIYENGFNHYMKLSEEEKEIVRKKANTYFYLDYKGATDKLTSLLDKINSYRR